MAERAARTQGSGAIERHTITWGDAAVRAPLRAIAERPPLVHCMTNIVVAGFTANVLLAIGASPAMVENPDESGEFAAIASALLINLGTLSPSVETAMRQAAAAARQAGTPWVLDPVAVGALAHRSRLAAELLADGPAIVRGNASEIMSLAGLEGAGGRGVDSLAASEQAIEAAAGLARRIGGAVAVSGEVDLLTDGARVLVIPGGDPLMTRVTGVGCALGAVMAACVAVADPLEAAASASALFAAAGERAAETKPGPGSFAVGLLDVLCELAATP